jgi:hypothetical protein
MFLFSQAIQYLLQYNPSHVPIIQVDVTVVIKAIVVAPGPAQGTSPLSGSHRRLVAGRRLGA